MDFSNVFIDFSNVFVDFSMKISNFFHVFLLVFLIFPNFSSFLSIIPIPFSIKNFNFAWFFPSFHHFFLLPCFSSFPPGTADPGGIERPSRNCSMVRGPSRVLADDRISFIKLPFRISYVTIESVYKIPFSFGFRIFYVTIESVYYTGKRPQTVCRRTATEDPLRQPTSASQYEAPRQIAGKLFTRHMFVSSVHFVSQEPLQESCLRFMS